MKPFFNILFKARDEELKVYFIVDEPSLIVLFLSFIFLCFFYIVSKYFKVVK